ncbi:hypothetical protein [Pseudomonas sp. DP-17]|uniref:hypothetical protein n=1 Tax=Pseudomonas sp. DP-17 TaxID=1580486 RepID=UPI001EFB65EA|nr:hypothetical protein [Pseudomonas sp. DP-17]MCG8911282.1 hypothetical protein [Pseudomonas sp. DP-17]
MSLRWKVAALVLTGLLLVSAGAALGGWLAAGHYRPLLDAANYANEKCVAARGNLEELAKEQGSKLGELVTLAEQRQAKATQAVADAQQQTSQHYAAAQRLQQERAEGDQCAASEAVIDKELGL